MTNKPAALLLAGLLALAATPASASFRVLSTGPDAKPADPAYEPSRTVFDCAARDTVVLAPGMTLTRSGDTTDGDALIDAYPCAPWNESGPEHIYRIDVILDLQLRAALSDLGTVDLDLFLLEGCDSDLCLVGANTEWTVDLAPGTYYVIVDGFGGAAGSYTLDLEARAIGVPDIICTPGGAAAVLCAGETIDVDGDLAGAADQLRDLGCNPAPLRGGESWYRLELPELHEVTITASPTLPELDIALWLVDGCGAEAVCLDFADVVIGGQTELMTVVNEDETPRTVYLAVDSPRPVEAGAGGFTLSFACQSNVATENTSLGSVRALFR